jgi:hypothetical protein
MSNLNSENGRGEGHQNSASKTSAQQRTQALSRGMLSWPSRSVLFR